MTDRNLNKVSKLPTETWKQTLDFANRQISLLLARCDELKAIADSNFENGERWRKLTEKLTEENGVLKEQADERNRLKGYKDRVQEEDRNRRLEKGIDVGR